MYCATCGAILDFDVTRSSRRTETVVGLTVLNWWIGAISFLAIGIAMVILGATIGQLGFVALGIVAGLIGLGAVWYLRENV